MPTTPPPAATLEVVFDGLCAYFPDVPETGVLTAIVVSAEPIPDYPHKHHAFFAVDSSCVQTPPGRSISEEVHGADIVLFDGTSPILARPQTFDHTGMLELTKHPFNFPALPPGVKNTDTLTPFGSARLLLPGGTVEAVDMTQEEYVVVHENDTTSASPVLGRVKLAQGLRYTRPLTNNFATVEVRTSAGTKTFTLKPNGGTISILIENHDVPARRLQKGVHNRDVDFALVYHLFGQGDAKPKFFPQQADPELRGAEGIQLPCVGGCTC